MRGGIHDLEGVALISITEVPATQDEFIIHKGDLSVSLNTQQIDNSRGIHHYEGGLIGIIEDSGY